MKKHGPQIVPHLPRSLCDLAERDHGGQWWWLWLTRSNPVLEGCPVPPPPLTLPCPGMVHPWGHPQHPPTVARIDTVTGHDSHTQPPPPHTLLPSHPRAPKYTSSSSLTPPPALPTPHACSLPRSPCLDTPRTPSLP